MNLNDIIKNDLCIGCGLCSKYSEVEKLVYSEKKGQFLPVLRKDKVNESFPYCPGMGYEIVELANVLNNDSNKKNRLELGNFIGHRIVHSKDESILKYSSSGGVLTELSLFLLENHYVEAVINAKFDYSVERGPIAFCSISKSKEDLLKSQGSKYCPVNYSEILDYINKFTGKVVIIATPCVIAMIKKMTIVDPILDKKILLTMTNFCGGYKNYNNIKILAKRKNINYKNLKSFRFRGNGQPGNMEFIEKNGKIATIPYPNYSNMNGLTKHLRCRLCVDATGELADISCGDAWLEKFSCDDNQRSIVLTRSKLSESIILEMINKNKLVVEKISIDDVIKSQKYNIDSKKYRQESRFKLYKYFHRKIPNFDGGYQIGNTNLLLELKVILSHKIKQILETLNLYWIIYRILK